MCGIVGYIGNNNAEDILIDGLKKLEYRGYDSSGIAVYNNDKISVVKTKGRIVNLENRLKNKEIQGSLGIGHTRWATHGEPSDINSHPHSNETETISIVHNGIIENYMSLKEELIQKGYKFQSDTDTEIIVHLLDHMCKQTNDLVDALIKVMYLVEGSYAVAVVSKQNPDRLIAAKKDSPLIIGLGKDENYIASDIPAILKYTRNIYFMEDGEIAIIKKDNIKIIDKDKKEIKKEIYKVDYNIEAAEKNGFEHFMLKEIYDQPKVIKDTLIPRLPLNSDEVVLDDIKLSKEDLNKINKIYMVACGTASYATLVGKYLIERVAKIPVVSEPASEFRYRDPVLDENTLVIVVSQSGETADTLAALRLSKKAGARVVGIVNAVGSTIARESDDLLYTLAGPEIAVASTKAYSCQLIAMYLLSCHIGLLKDKITKEEFKVLREHLYKLPEQVERILEQKDKIKAIADKYKNSKNIFYVGRGLDFAASMEGSLKLKEIAYLHSEPYAAGELKHGPIALIEDGTLVVGLLCHEELNDKTISNLKEVKARGAKILAIAQEDNKKALQSSDDIIFVPKTHWMFTSILENIPQQLFAYYVAVGLGNDVDKPRNLAKSVTVE